MSEDTFRFAIDPSRYDLRSPNSLHDSHINSIHVSHGDISLQSNIERIDISITLWSKWGDKKHVLQYYGVRVYDLVNIKSGKYQPSDVLVHEFRFENGFLIHEIALERSASIKIECEKFHYSEGV